MPLSRPRRFFFLSLLGAAVVAGSLATPFAFAVEAPATQPDRGPGPQDTWLLRLPESDRPVFQGNATFASAGSGSEGAFMYPAPNIAGFLVAVAIHAAAEGSAQAHRRTKIQQQADQVLRPYQKVLDALSLRELTQKALELTSLDATPRLADASPGSGWIVESHPVFSMSRDGAALTLDHVMILHTPDDPSPAGTPRAVRVVSAPVPPAEAAPFERWNAHEGEALKQQSIELLAESLDVALGPAATRSSSTGAQRPYKTVRYPFGNAEAMERAQVLKESCDRLVLSKRPAIPS